MCSGSASHLSRLGRAVLMGEWETEEHYQEGRKDRTCAQGESHKQPKYTVQRTKETLRTHDICRGLG